MKIQKLKIKNFRCFGPEESNIPLEDLTAFIGSNSTGKTAVLQALQKLFGTNRSDRMIYRSDFHVPHNKSPENMEESDLYIEAVIDLPEVKDGKENVAKRTIPPFFERLLIDGNDQPPYIRIRLEAKWKKGNTPEGEIEDKLWFINKPEEENETIKDDHKISMQSEHRTQIQVIYVPAIREPSRQLKNTSGTILGRILNGIKWSDEIDSNIKAKSKEIDAIFDNEQGVKKLRAVLSEQWKHLHSDVRYTDANVKFSSSDLSSILQKTEVEFCPTETERSYEIDNLGEGLRSLFYFSLVNSLLHLEGLFQEGKDNGFWKKNFNPPALTVLAVEEPENHIAPQLLGRIIERLKSLATGDNAQVLLTSHTPAIIKRIDPKAIRHLRMSKNRHCSIVSRILLPKEDDEAYKFVKEAVKAYPEIYFARLVILGEGDTEEIIIPKAIEVYGYDIDHSGVSIVPLGGQYVNHFWKLLNQLDIPYLTLLDLDSERYGGGWGRIKYACTQLIENGFDRASLLNEPQGQNYLENMANLQLNTAEDMKLLSSWVKYLENYCVFFSTPLDLDFAMLTAFPDEYKTINIARGPRIPKDEDKKAEYIKNAIDVVLKEKCGEGNTYSEAEKSLMPWYRYLFLMRGKPSTHIMAISKIDDDNFKNKLPIFLKDIIKKTGQILNDDPYSGAFETINKEVDRNA